MNEKQYEEVLRRLDLIEFRQDLLFNNSGTDRLLYEAGITRTQYDQIMDLMEEFRNKIYKKEKCTSADFESKMYKILPEHNGDYHLCESLALCLYEAGRWTEVFTTLYGNNPKFADVLNNKH